MLLERRALAGCFALARKGFEAMGINGNSAVEVLMQHLAMSILYQGSFFSRLKKKLKPWKSFILIGFCYLSCSWGDVKLNSGSDPCVKMSIGLTRGQNWYFLCFFTDFWSVQAFDFFLLGLYIAHGLFPATLLSLPSRFDTWFSLIST